jgi:adenylosuccinate synthase
VLHHSRGEYIELDGWKEDITACRSPSDLPTAARDYLAFIAEQIKVPVALVGVGPGREQVIWMQDAPQLAAAA